MNKLELKHIAPYLPYGLMVKRNDSILIVKGIINDLYIFDEETYGSISSSLSKPILRPLSDLIPIEDNEVNDMVLIKIVDGTDQHCDAYDEWRDTYFDDPEPSRILQAPYEVFEELLRQHFDVFDLIGQNLAVNINTLKEKK